MGLTLKDRKKIQNTLPRFILGSEPIGGQYRPTGTIPFASELNSNYSNKIISFSPPSMDDITKEAGNFNFAGKTEGVTTAADAFKDEQIAKNNAATDALPSFKKKSGVGSFLKNNLKGIGDAAMSTFNFANTIAGLSKNTMSSDEMMGSGGTIQSSANGIGFTESRVDDAGIQNQINAQAKAATMTGLTQGAQVGGNIGKLLGPFGEKIGEFAGGAVGGFLGFLGGKNAKEEAERQKTIAINRTNAANAQNREQAYAIGLRNEFNRENRTDTSQSLFHADLGKEKLKVNPFTGKTFQNTLIYTAYGPAIGHQRGWGTKGEVITDDFGYGYEIPTGPNDTAKIDVDDGGSIYSENVKNPSTGNSVAHDAKILLRAGNGKMSISNKNWLDMNQKVGRMMMYAGKRKIDTNPGYLGGTLKKFSLGVEMGNLLPLINAYAIASASDARAKGVHRANSLAYATNPYGNAAMERLSGLRQDYYPVFSKNREIEARAWNGIRNSGGLSAGQSALFGALLSNQTQQNNADAIFNSQMANNQLISQAEKAKIALGDSNATRAMQGYQWDTDYFAKGHGAQSKIYATNDYIRQDALTQYFKNLDTNRKYLGALSLYKDQQKIDRDKLQQLMNNIGVV